MKYRVLIADDERIERMVLRKKIEKLFPGECEVAEAVNGAEAVQLYEQDRAQILILDIRMPGMTGLQAAQQIRETDRSASIIFLTAFDEFAYARQAIAVRAMDYLLKPCDERELEAAVQEAMRMQSQEMEMKGREISAPERRAEASGTDHSVDAGHGSEHAAGHDSEHALEHAAAKEDIRQEQILSYIHAHYTEDLSVQDIAGECGYTDVYFCRIFKQYFGRSFVTYLTDFRIEEAKKLLLTSQLGVGEIGRRVGYGDPNYFAKVFRRVSGVSPKEFRDREKITNVI